MRPGRARAVVGQAGEGPVDEVRHQAGIAAAVPDHGQTHVVPQRMARQDAEVATDIGDDSADRPAADFGRDLLRGGQVRGRLLGFGNGSGNR